MADWKTYHEQITKNSQAPLDWLASEYNSLRTGRANPAVLDGVRVESFGEMVPLRRIANVQVAGPRLLVVKPFDRAAVAEIVAGINKANIGLVPTPDGDKINLPVPSPTEEGRKLMAKRVRELAEQTKASLRNVRQDVHKKIRADKELTDDDHRYYEDELNKAVKKLNAQVDELAAAKEREVTTV